MIVNYFTKKSIVCKFFAAIVFLFFFSTNLSAQLVVTPGVSAATLVSSLTGQGLTVSNVNLNCPTNAYGTFSNGNTTNMGITNGILLTTGSAVNAIGPNNSTSMGTCNGTSGSDPQLTAIEPLATEDLCVLEFDIVPQCNNLQVRFVFGSEEYPEFVNSSFNDAFGFFITGPGPACQAGFYNNTNVATLPNNVTPVSIDNVNATTNNAFYVNNAGGTTIQYDGFTTILTRNITLCPCQTYHWKLAIADAGDCVYDSGVFVDFISCSSALSLTTSFTNSGCSGCTGTATVTPVGGTGPFTYSWAPSGGNAATATNLCPGTYTVTVVDALSCSPPSTAVVTIGNTGTPITLSGTQTNVLCNGQCTGSATVNVVSGTGPFTYSWAPSGGTAATTTGRCAGTYTVTVTGAGGCTATQTFNITQPPALTATQSQVNILCNGQCTGSATVVAGGGTPGYTYSWAPSGGTAATATGRCAGTYTCTITDANGCTITRSFNITQPPALTSTGSQVNLLCNGVCNGSATVVASGGTAPYTYSWAPSGGTAATASALCAGTFTCTITDANGCTTTRSFTITQPPALTATQSQVNVLCNGACTGSATVVASGGTAPYTYSWAPSGGTGASATGRCAGTYTVTITDANGCTITRTFNITQPPALSTTGSQVNVLCNGQCTGSATVVASGGTAPYTYSWAPSGGTAATASALCTGTYTVTVTDANGCTTTRTFNITQPPALTATQSQVNVLCNGQCTGSATVVPSGGTAPYTYSWAPSGGTAATATGRCAGTYTVTITDANGCTITRTFNITQPPAMTTTQSQVNILCNGACTGSATVVPSGGTAPYTYAWAPSGGTAATATGRCAGTYTVTVTDANGCTITASFNITQPPALSTTGSQVNVLCNGSCTGSATVVAAGGTAPYTYSWAPSGGTAATASALCAGTYTVTVTDANGCTTTRTFSITQPPALTATQSQVNVLCNGACTGSATVVPSGGTAPYTYAWAPSGGTAATATGRCAGTYTVTITDANGCSITRTFNITQPPAMTTTQSQVNILCNGACTGSATVVPSGGTAPYTYAWAPSGGTAATATGRCAGTYTVTVTDANGCTITASFNITQPPAMTTTGSQVNLTCNAVCNGSATVVPSGGAAPYTYSWAPSGGTAATASSLCAGNYTVTVTDANGCTTTRTFSITQPPAITATQSQLNVACNGQCTGSATVVASGGTGTYTYAWAPSGGTAASATGLCAGTYTCTISSPAGCSITQTFNITQPTAVTASTTTTAATCGGTNGTATVTASGGAGPYTYSWAPSGGTGTTATGLAAGSYTVTVTSTGGCTVTAVAVVPSTGGITASITASTNVSCFGGSNGSATATPTGGTAPFTYAWAPSGGTAATATGLIAGSYTCTITDANGCIATASVTITQPPALTATQSQVNVNCNGVCNGSATVVASGGTPAYTYAWAPSGGTTATASALCAGNYTCTITDANGCVITRTFNITQPTAVTGTTSSVPVACNGGTNGTATVVASGGTPGYTYSWAPSGGTGATTTGVAAGTYTVTITDANGCTGTATVTITQPTAVTASATTVSATCGNPNGSATVTPGGGVGPYTYSWAPSGGTGATASGLLAGSYTVTVTDSRGCTTTAIANVPNSGGPTANISATTNVTCFGGNNGSATVTVAGGTAPYTYAWAPSGGTGSTANTLIAGSYTVTVTDANGCTTTATATITQPPVITATQSQVNVTCNAACNGSATVVASGGTGTYTYAWAPSGGTAATATGLCAGTYTVTISSPVGCSITQSFTITQPTPVTGTTTTIPVTCNGGSTGSVTVTASGGTPGYTYSWAPSGGTGATTTGVPAGNYTVTITDASGCTGTASATVTQPTAVTASTTTVTATCGNPNGSATVTAAGGTPGYTYSWAPSGGTGATATGLLAGSYTVTVTDAQGCTTTATATIINSGGPSASISASTNVSCFSGSNGSATVAVVGGTAPLTYAWAPSGGTGATATGLVAGSYTVTVTDANGCTTTASVTLTQPPALTASATSTPVLCNGGATGTATVTPGGGSPAYTYNWAPSGGTGATATGLIAGTYTCTVTDANGCTITATTTVTQPTAVTATNSTTPVLCNGGTTGTASVVASNGTPGYTYSWAPSGGTGATATGLAAGTYTCTITDANGCPITSSLTVTEPTAVTATSTTVTAICGNPTGSATVTASGGTPGYTYSWAPSGGTGATASNLAAGTYTCTITDANGCSITHSVTIVNAGSPTAAITASTNILCFGGNNGSATVTASSGTAPYTYSWAPSGGTGATATGLIAGSYTVTVTDANGCTTTASVTLTEPPVLTASATSTPALCNGGATGTATVTAGGGSPAYTYSWAPSGGTGATATGLIAGTYTCTVTDANGCTTTATTTVTEPTPLTATISTTPVLCNAGNTGTATVVASGATPGYTYSWAPSGGTSASASGLTAGGYTCTITDANSCSITISITVTEPTALTLATSFVQSTCGNANGSASVVASGATPGYTYSWAPTGGTGPNATGLLAGSYTVTVTDANLCTQTATVVVPNAGSPTAAITATVNVSCFGGNDGSATVTGAGGTPPYTYAWTPTGGTGATGTGLIAGNYTVTLTDANGCTTTATVTITEPPVLTASATSSPVLCFGGNTGSATVTGAGGVTPYTYAWAPSGGTGATENGLIAGSYTCTVTDANGCTTTASTTVTEPPALTISTTQIDVACNGGSTGAATVTVGGGTPVYTYAWTPSGGTGATENGLAAGSYTCTVTDANGCIITASVTITEPPLLTLTTSFVQSTCGNANGSASVVATGGTPGYTYSWAPSGGTGPNETGLLAGSYTVTVTDTKGCSTTATVVVPNAGSPTATITAVTNISCFGGNDGSITVTGAGGTLPYTYAWSPSGGTGATETGLVAGSYTVTITDANGCTATADTTLTEPPALTISGTSTNVDCFGNANGTASVVVGGGVTAYTYAWLPSGGVSANEIGLIAGTYTCNVTDANGCTISQSFTITEPPQLTLAIAGFNVSCFSACDGQVVVIPTGGVPNYTFLWNTGCNNPSCSNICAGTYTVDVTDANGCLTSATTTVTEPTAISITTAAVDAHCNQADGSVSANASGGTGTLTYQWIGGPANANYNAIVAGTYSVIVTDANGCSDTATVTVNNLNGVNASLVSVTNLTCFQSNDGAIVTNAIGGNGPYVYAWTPNVSATNTATGIPANSYSLVVTDADGCTSTVTAVVTEPTDVTLVASATPGAVCAGSGVQLSSTGGGGTPGYTYSWMPGPLAGNTQNIIPAATTTYTAYVVDANGCSDSTTVLVTVNPVPVAILVGDQTSGCAPLCVNFSDISTIAAPGVITSWTWDFGDGSPVSTQQNPSLHCYNTPGAYTVTLTITTADGCTSTIVMPAYINVFALPVAAFGATPQPTTILNPEITFADSSLNASTWNWSFGDLIPSSTSSLQNPTFTYTTPDCYQVILEVTSIDGCIDTAMKEICIDPDAVIYVPNAFTPNGDGNNEEFIPVSIGIDPDQYELWIFDRWGNMIFYTDDLNKGWDGRVQGHTEISQIDTYVWKIKAVDITGNKHNLLGKVSLIK